LVYNISNAREAANEGQPIIVAEGYADVIALVQAGFKGAVAPLGTALTETQISLLWDMIPHGDVDFVKEPILCFDGDNAGQRAAVRAMERILPILRPGVSARFAFMPTGQDPDDVLKSKGVDAMQIILDAAIPLHDMIWQNLTAGKDFDRPEQRAALLDAIEKAVIQIADRNIQQSYRQMLKDKFYQRSRGRKGNARGVNNIKLSKPNANQELVTRLIMGVLLYHPAYYDSFEEQIAAIQCHNTALDGLRQNVISILSDTSGITHEELLKALKNRGIEGEQIASLTKDMKLHAPYVFDEGAQDNIQSGLKELLDRVAV
jgi:DNA primase